MTDNSTNTPSDTEEANFDRYQAAVHRQQSALAFLIGLPGRVPDVEPKHLRVGVNNAMSDHGAIAKLLIDKGIITSEEYIATIADFAEMEADKYVQRAREVSGIPHLNFS